MTNSFSKPDNKAAKHLLPLVMDKSLYSKIPKNWTSKFQLRSTPNQADSAKYEITVYHIDENTELRLAIKTIADLEKAIGGLNITPGRNAMGIITGCLHGSVKGHVQQYFNGEEAAKHEVRKVAARQQAADDGQTEAQQQAAYDNAPLPEDTVPMARRALLRSLEIVAPAKALARVKRQLRRETRKPRDMSTRLWINRLLAINRDEVPCLPPFLPNQRLSMDEIIDIVLSGIPNSWEKQMYLQGFDPLVHSIDEITEFCERMEANEDFSSDSRVKGKTEKNDKKKRPKNSSNSRQHCQIHGDCGHSTDECKHVKSILAEAKKSGRGGRKVQE